MDQNTALLLTDNLIVTGKGMNLERKPTAFQIPQLNTFVLEELAHVESKKNVSNQIILMNIIK